MITPDNARRDVLLLCLHGGGFISGSAASHGQMYAHLAKAVGCQALVLDYPLAPEEPFPRSEEHTSELQSLMRISYAVFCLKTQKKNPNTIFPLLLETITNKK